MTPHCNICGGTEFHAYKGRPAEMCPSCKSKARHRVGLAVYEKFLFPLTDADPQARVLHMAPERCLHRVLADRLGDSYVTSDPEPERYLYAKCLRRGFPDGFREFEDGYFTGIIHNHILEHIPGHYGDHLKEFARLLAPGGVMIFSFPGPYGDVDTLEGGEHMESDAERIEHFGVAEHIKIFGPEFYDVYQAIPGGHPLNDGVTDDLRASLRVRPGMAPFHVWRRAGGANWGDGESSYTPPPAGPVPKKPDPKALYGKRTDSDVASKL